MENKKKSTKEPTKEASKTSYPTRQKDPEIVATSAAMLDDFIANGRLIALGIAILAAVLLLIYTGYARWESLPEYKGGTGTSYTPVTPSAPVKVASLDPSFVPVKKMGPIKIAFTLGVPDTRTYGQNLAVVTEDNLQLRGVVHQGCVTWYAADGRALGHSCEGYMPSINGIVSLRADTEAVIEFNHCRLWTPGNRIDRCG